MVFTTEKLIRFHHCDPAGIVYYPRYFELLHEAQEDWLAHIGHPEHAMIASGFGLPIVGIDTQFSGMCRFGERVWIDVSVRKLGNSSLGMRYCLYSKESSIPGGLWPKTPQNAPSENTSQATEATERIVKLQAQSVVVYTDLKASKAAPWSAELRAAIEPYVESA
jgi:4-hydroxybenzoyl-CoA thioesterase